MASPDYFVAKTPTLPGQYQIAYLDPLVLGDYPVAVATLPIPPGEHFPYGWLVEPDV